MGKMLELDEGHVTFESVGNMLIVKVDEAPYHEPSMSWTLDLTKDGATLRDWLTKKLRPV